MMKVEIRKRKNNPDELILICQNGYESACLDSVFGEIVQHDGFINHTKGEIMLSDGHREHYICLRAID